MNEFLKLMLVGTISGFVSGFFGAGGGIVLILALSFLMKSEQKGIFAQTSLITATFAAVSAIMYSLKGNLPINTASRYIIPAALGGAVGAVLLRRLKLKIVKRVVALSVILGGLIMIFR